jgi:hypothetical protein
LISIVVTPPRIIAWSRARAEEISSPAEALRGRLYRRCDAAAAAGDLFVRGAVQPLLELFRPIAAEDQMGVAIDKARSDHAPPSGSIERAR